jgi:hypothetical protein
MSPEVALSGHADGPDQRPVLGQDRTWPNDAAMSRIDPSETLVARGVSRATEIDFSLFQRTGPSDYDASF